MFLSGVTEADERRKTNDERQDSFPSGKGETRQLYTISQPAYHKAQTIHQQHMPLWNSLRLIAAAGPQVKRDVR